MNFDLARHRSNVYANWSATGPRFFAIHVETTQQPRIRGKRIPTADTSTALTTAKGVRDTLKKVNFNLTKWRSNSREFCQQMQDDLFK